MTLYLLRDIPREIRDQIWGWVLASAFGCVSLQSVTTFARPFNDTPRVNIMSIDPRTYDVLTSEPAIRLMNLLRTCSQIHLEAKNALWRNNSLAFSHCESIYSHSRLQDPRFSYGIESVHLSIDILGTAYHSALRGSSVAMDRVLKILGLWAREGSLRSLTLTLLPENQVDRGMAGLNRLLDIWKVGSLHSVQSNLLDVSSYSSYLAKLEDAGSYLPTHLKRKILFDTDWDALPIVLKQEWMNKRGVFHPQDLIKEIHDKFGGEFWMDGKLCFKNHEEVERVFDV